MPSRPAFSLFALALFALGCSHTYGLERQEPGSLAVAPVAFFVALAEPGSFETTVYPDSGRQTSEAIARGLAARGHTTRIGAVPEEAEQALESARSEGTDYLVYPIIEHWEERATEWSGLPDRIRIAVRVYETDTGALRDASTVTGKSRWATFGGDHPQELLEPGLEPWFQDLFAEALP